MPGRDRRGTAGAKAAGALAPEARGAPAPSGARQAQRRRALWPRRRAGLSTGTAREPCPPRLRDRVAQALGCQKKGKRLRARRRRTAATAGMRAGEERVQEVGPKAPTGLDSAPAKKRIYAVEQLSAFPVVDTPSAALGINRPDYVVKRRAWIAFGQSRLEIRMLCAFGQFVDSPALFSEFWHCITHGAPARQVHIKAVILVGFCRFSVFPYCAVFGRFSVFPYCAVFGHFKSKKKSPSES